jgi:citrate lyase subunit beta / citryl-CoA lyase
MWCAQRSAALIWAPSWGVDPDDTEALLWARSALVMGSAAAGRPAPLDGVTNAVRDDGAVTADATRAARLGFGGKLCIHPSQVTIVNASFQPSASDLACAREVVAAAGGDGACVVDDRMIDRPVVARAARIIARAEQFAGSPGSGPAPAQ